MGGWEHGRMGGWEHGRMGGWENWRMRGWEHGKKGGWMVVLFMLVLANVQAQDTFAPDFLCVTNDTLRWNLPPAECSDFNNYTIFASQNVDGPYAELTVITDPQQTQFFHANAGNDAWFYYLTADINCNGRTNVPSDTLDNRIPQAGLMRYVSVRGEDVEIGWEESASPEVFAYIISKNTASGTAIIDTVFDGTTYLDTTAMLSEGPETYFVVAIDRCGNSSLIPPPHTTMLLEGMGASACDRTVDLSWDLYQNWENPITRHEIWVSENGAEPYRAGEAAGSATSFTFQNAGADIEYCFTVRAVEAGTGNIASTNEVCLTLDVIPGVTELVVTNASVTTGNAVNVAWIWNDNAQIERTEVQRSSGGANFATINSEAPASPLNRNNTFLDEGADPTQGSVFYQIQTTDACDVIVTSNAVGTVFLQAQTQNLNNNFLSWSDYQNENTTDVVYEVYRQTASGTPDLITTDASGANEYTDGIDPNDPAQASACYFVIARATVTLRDGSMIEVESRSNTACVSQDSELFIPNAFVPDGVNREFRPVLQFGLPADYAMVIYDRWGGLLFETQSIEQGWDGRTNGNPLPQGVYTYHIKLTQTGGKVIERAGTFVLIR